MHMNTSDASYTLLYVCHVNAVNTFNGLLGENSSQFQGSAKYHERLYETFDWISGGMLICTMDFIASARF